MHDHLAQPLSVLGVPNFYRVVPHFYRSGQPSYHGFQHLEEMGIRSILNLREYHRDRRKARHTTLHLFRLPMAAGQLTEAHLRTVLQCMKQAPKPLLLHCWHGSDRTGALVAAFRIVVQGWSIDEAEEEFRLPEFGHHEFWYANIPRLLRNTNWDDLRTAWEAAPGEGF